VAKGSVKEIDRGWDRINREVRRIAASGAHVDCGIQGGEVDPDSLALVSDIAFFNEFGTRDIPSRPFMRQAIDENIDSLFNMKDRIFSTVIDGKRTAAQGLGLLGEHVVGLIQKKIVDLREPPNTPETIERKGSDNPLVDTGQMRQSVTKVVKA
jgi:hypothetical protein